MTYGQLESLLNKIDKYEEVLDEIRKYIDNENFVDENICMVESMAILKILDKVKDL